MSEIEERVKQIIVDKLGVSESEVTPEATFSQFIEDAKAAE